MEKKSAFISSRFVSSTCSGLFGCLSCSCSECVHAISSWSIPIICLSADSVLAPTFGHRLSNRSNCSLDRVASRCELFNYLPAHPWLRLVCWSRLREYILLRRKWFQWARCLLVKNSNRLCWFQCHKYHRSWWNGAAELHKSGNKRLLIKGHVVDNDVDISTLTETWLHSDNRDDQVIGDFIPVGYSFHHVPRGFGNGGNVGILVKNGFHVEQTTAINRQFDSFEFIDSLNKSDSCRDIRVLVIYRPPSCDFSLFLDDLMVILITIRRCRQTFIWFLQFLYPDPFP